MEILKITGKEVSVNKINSLITANPKTKSIGILGFRFSSKNLETLSIWLQEYIKINEQDITLNFLAYQAPIGDGYFNMASFPVKLFNDTWRNLYESNDRFDISNQNELGKTLSLLKTFNFVIEGTENTMKIQGHFDGGLVKISGRFCDYKPFLEFEPLIAWIENYISCGKRQLSIHFKLWYYNTAMSFVIKHFLSFLKDADLEIDISWFYPDDDPDMKDAGIEYKTVMGFSDETMSLVEYKID